MTPRSAGIVGNVLLVSGDSLAIGQLAGIMQELALSVEVCGDVSTAIDRLKQRKFEAVVVDFLQKHNAIAVLEQLRSSPSNRTAVAFALTGGTLETTQALRAGASFALEKPLTYESVSHTLRAAYGLIVRERRRYFRCPVAVPATLSRKGMPVVYGETVNVSERGMAFRAPAPLTPGTEGMAEFSLPEPVLRIAAESRVCWNDHKGLAGLAFIFLPPAMSSELQGWLALRLEEQLPSPVTQKFQAGPA
jgi:CheY-like chemotaxis protein